MATVSANDEDYFSFFDKAQPALKGLVDLPSVRSVVPPSPNYKMRGFGLGGWFTRTKEVAPARPASPLTVARALDENGVPLFGAVIGGYVDRLGIDEAAKLVKGSRSASHITESMGLGGAVTASNADEMTPYDTAIGVASIRPTGGYAASIKEVYELGMLDHYPRAQYLTFIKDYCATVESILEKNPKARIYTHCWEGRNRSATLLAGYLIWCKLREVMKDVTTAKDVDRAADKVDEVIARLVELRPVVDIPKSYSGYEALVDWAKELVALGRETAHLVKTGQLAADDVDGMLLMYIGNTGHAVMPLATFESKT